MRSQLYRQQQAAQRQGSPVTAANALPQPDNRLKTAQLRGLQASIAASPRQQLRQATGQTSMQKKSVIQRVEPEVAGFTPENFLFASAEKGVVGSLYFKNGRIRLMHEQGPTVSLHHHPIEQYTITKAAENLKDEEYNRYLYKLIDAGKLTVEQVKREDFRLTDEQFQELYSIIYTAWREQRATCLNDIDVNDLPTLAIGARGVLMEYMMDEEKIVSYHISRGGPVSIAAYSQEEINALCRAAQSGDNATMEQCLQTIRPQRALKQPAPVRARAHTV